MTTPRSVGLLSVLSLLASSTWPAHSQQLQPDGSSSVTADLPLLPDDWQRYTKQLLGIKIDHQPIEKLLGPLLRHKYSLQLAQVRRSTGYVGSNSRLRRVVLDLLTGQHEVKIGVVGGSISWGTGAVGMGALLRRQQPQQQPAGPLCLAFRFRSLPAWVNGLV